MDPIQDRIQQFLAAHPYTIYFSDELMDNLQLPFSVLEKNLLQMAENNIVDYKDASTDNTKDFMVKIILPALLLLSSYIINK